MEATLDLYTDYLLSSFGQTSATGLSRLLDEVLSHDAVTRFLNQQANDSKALWQVVKPFARQIQSATGVLLVDDSIMEKPYTDENGLITTHYDHSTGLYVRGINFVSLLYQVGDKRVPVGFELVVKTLRTDRKTRQTLWKSERTKNAMLRHLVRHAHQNALPFQYVVCDSCGSPPGYTNAENITAVLSLKKHLLGAVKSNLEVALSKQDRANGRFVKISSLALNPGARPEVYIRSVKQPVVVCKDLFVNQDGSTGELYLLSTDTGLTYQSILATYQQRWGIEEYHKSLKNNTSLTKSPTRTFQTQRSHFFACLCAYTKLERLKIMENTNQFALKGRLYLKAIQAAFAELADLKARLDNRHLGNQTLLAIP